VDFVYVSGHPSLNLVGTLKWRRRSRPEEQLLLTEQIGEWAVGAGLVDTPMLATTDDLRRVRAVREALYRAVTARLAGEPPPARDRTLLNRTTAGRPLGVTLDAQGALRLVASVDQLLTTIVLDAFELMRSDAFARVKECAQDDCTRLFVDTSRGGSRRWCGMAECGNRAKARAFRERQNATSSSGSRRTQHPKQRL